MSYCPECKAHVNDSDTTCQHCGKRIIPADSLENVPTKTSTWQKIVIAAGAIILIIIGLTFMGAEDREDKAAQQNFREPVASIVKAAAQTGLVRGFGNPSYTLTARPKSAIIHLVFPRGPIGQRQVSAFAMNICGALAKTYVDKGYMPRHLEVRISSKMPDGKIFNYGVATFNGNLDTLNWTPAVN